MSDLPSREALHMSVAESLEADEDGWFTPVCDCGQVGPPVPSVDIAADWLMQHAWNAASRMHQQETPDE